MFDSWLFDIGFWFLRRKFELARSPVLCPWSTENVKGLDWVGFSTTFDAEKCKLFADVSIWAVVVEMVGLLLQLVKEYVCNEQLLGSFGDS